MRGLGKTNEGAMERGNADDEFLTEAVFTSLRLTRATIRDII